MSTCLLTFNPLWTWSSWHCLRTDLPRTRRFDQRMCQLGLHRVQAASVLPAQMCPRESEEGLTLLKRSAQYATKQIPQAPESASFVHMDTPDPPTLCTRISHSTLPALNRAMGQRARHLGGQAQGCPESALDYVQGTLTTQR